MRFALAAAALVWQTLPASSSAAAVDEKRRQESTSNSIWAATNKRVLRNSPLTLSSRRPERKARKTTLAKARPLANARQKTTKDRDVVECDPNAPDQGILACGNALYCVESSASSLGGSCASRRLQAPSCSQDTPCPEGGFCALDFGTEGTCEICPCGNPVSKCYAMGHYNQDDSFVCASACEPVPYDYYDYYRGNCQYVYGTYPYDPFCDASGYDYYTNTGTVICQDTYCYNSCCSGYERNYTRHENGTISFSVSYNFTRPYYQSASFYVRGGLECGVSFNGEMCNWCNVTEQDYTYYDYTYRLQCFQFNCSNVIPGHNNSDCLRFGGVLSSILTVSDQCGTDYVVCNICGPGRELMYPETKVVLPYDGLASCEIAYRLGSEGYYGTYGSDGCTALSIAASSCCRQEDDGPRPSPGCSICGDGELVYPDATVYLPDTGQYECRALYSAGLLGYFGADGCSGFEAIAGPTCCGSLGS